MYPRAITKVLLRDLMESSSFLCRYHSSMCKCVFDGGYLCSLESHPRSSGSLIRSIIVITIYFQDNLAAWDVREQPDGTQKKLWPFNLDMCVLEDT